MQKSEMTYFLPTFFSPFRVVQNAQLAETFHSSLTMNAYGLRPWMRLMSDLRLNTFLAEKHYEWKVLGRTLNEFVRQCRKQVESGNKRAERQFQKRLVEKSFGQWLKVSWKNLLTINANYNILLFRNGAWVC
jgi:hypothetical protein